MNSLGDCNAAFTSISISKPTVRHHFQLMNKTHVIVSALDLSMDISDINNGDDKRVLHSIVYVCCAHTNTQACASKSAKPTHKYTHDAFDHSPANIKLMMINSTQLARVHQTTKNTHESVREQNAHTCVYVHIPTNAFTDTNSPLLLCIKLQ